MKLRDYQKECINVIRNEDSNHLIVIATGGGKTVIFTHLAVECSRKGERILIVVPQEELLQQTKNTLLKMDSNLDIGIVKAEKDDVHSNIVIATRQSLTHSKSTRIERMNDHGKFKYVIIDEVHQANKQSLTISSKIPNAKILGFTATPFNIELNKIFKKGISFQKTVLDMIEEGYLVEPRAYRVKTDTDISKVKAVNGEFSQGELEITINNSGRNLAILKAYKKKAKKRKSTIVFCAGVQHAIDMAKTFKDDGIEAEFLSGDTNPEDRKRIIEDFKNGKIKVLTNCQVLTTGFDAPNTDCIIFASPTRSKTKYVQCLGRGLRLFTGKQDCLILDFIDEKGNHTVIDIDDIFDITIEDGENVSEAKERNKEEEELERKRKKERELKIKEEMLRLEIERIELLKRKEDSHKNAISGAILDWYEEDFGYVLKLNKKMCLVILNKKDYKYDIYELIKKEDNGHYEKIYNIEKDFEFLNEAIDYIECDESYMKICSSFSYKNIPWKSDSATENQLKYIKDNACKTKWDAIKYFEKYKLNKAVKSIKDIV